MKANEIKKCVLCGKGVMHTGLPLFYRVTIDRMFINKRAVHELAGLQMMLGAQLADVFSTGENIADVGISTILIICEHCGPNKSNPIAGFAEIGCEAENDKEG